MNCEHTPTPWSADKWATGFTVSAPDSHYSICHLEDCNNAEANAEFIVRACNSHAELIRVLKEALTHNGVEHDTTLKEMIVSALKTAGEL